VPPRRSAGSAAPCTAVSTRTTSPTCNASSTACTPSSACTTPKRKKQPSAWSPHPPRHDRARRRRRPVRGPGPRRRRTRYATFGTGTFVMTRHSGETSARTAGSFGPCPPPQPPWQSRRAARRGAATPAAPRPQRCGPTRSTSTQVVAAPTAAARTPNEDSTPSPDSHPMASFFELDDLRLSLSWTTYAERRGHLHLTSRSIGVFVDGVPRFAFLVPEDRQHASASRRPRYCGLVAQNR
jgi:hypothetical protein